jgi:hypothetical protein
MQPMCTAVVQLGNPGGLAAGLDQILSLPGVELVVTTKIFRFCGPQHGAAVDRQASYFFNSLDIVDSVGAGSIVTRFVENSGNGRRTAPRSATHTASRDRFNRLEFIQTFLPLLGARR